MKDPYAETMFFALYFLPAVIALLRKSASTSPIVILDVFFGWTGIGWVIAFLWALFGDHYVRKPI